MISLPELAELAIKANLNSSHDGYCITCADLKCSTCIMRTSFADNKCIFWHSTYDQPYQKATLIPYLRQHHQEFFL